MDRRKPRTSSSDELALVKAAAWAWYQRGSGNEEKPICEFDLTRAHREPRPSRYKLEAIKASAAEESTDASSEPSSASLSPAHTENSLLDRYEIERITRQLDRLIASGGSGFSRAGGRRSSKNYPVSSPESDGNGRKMVPKVNGFWLRHAMGICSSRADVVEARVLVRRPRRQRFGQ